MTAALLHLLNHVAVAAPDVVIGLSLVAIVLAPRLRVLQFPGLVVTRRKAGSR